MESLGVVAGILSIVSFTGQLRRSLYPIQQVADAKDLLLSLNISIYRLERLERELRARCNDCKVMDDVLLRHLHEGHLARVVDGINKVTLDLSQGFTSSKKLPKERHVESGSISLPSDLTKEVDKAFKDIDHRKRGHRHFLRFYKNTYSQQIRKQILELDYLIDELERFCSLSKQAQQSNILSVHDNDMMEFVSFSISARQSALNLWSYCDCESLQAGLGVDIMSRKGTMVPLHVAAQAQEAQGATCFQMFLQHKSPDLAFVDFAVNVASLPGKSSRTVEKRKLACKLLQQGPSDQEPFILASEYCVTQTELQIRTFKKEILPGSLLKESNARSAEDKIDDTDKRGLFDSAFEEKIWLAYKLSECGVQLIGTPWLAQLSAIQLEHVFYQSDPAKMTVLKETLLKEKQSIGSRMKPNPSAKSLSEHDLYILNISHINLDDTTVQKSEILSEHHQIFDLGLLLIEIALGKLSKRTTIESRDRSVWASSVLPQVRLSMGNNYADACAYCVSGVHEGHWNSSRGDKYTYMMHTSWRDYLESFVANFYSQVYLKLYDLAIMARSQTADKVDAKSDLSRQNSSTC